MFIGKLVLGYATTHITLTTKIMIVKNMTMHDLGSRYSKPKYSTNPIFFLRSGIPFLP